jgi:aspartate/methionine/tyrosine aminotransferase
MTSSSPSRPPASPPSPPSATPPLTAAGADYLEWAKTRSMATFSLATSGVLPLPWAELGATAADLELTGDPCYGYPPLQQALAARTGAPETCVVAALGTSQANHLAMAAVLEPGDEVVIEQPGYEPLLAVASRLGARVRTFERTARDRFAVDPERVRAVVTARTRLIVVTRLHNPSGAPVSDETLQALGAIARGSGARVLVDEVYREMEWVEGACAGPGPRPAFLLGEEFITTSSLTKAYGLGGLRCGWALAAPALARRMWWLLDLTIGCAAHPAERLAVIALANLERIGRRARAILLANRPRLASFLESRDDLETVMPPCGTIVFPRWQGGDVEPLCAVLRERWQTTIVPGRYFGAPEHFRLGIGGDPAVVASGLDRLARALDALRARPS